MIDKALPLTDLHRHLDGNIRPVTIWQLSQAHEIQLEYQAFDELLLAIQAAPENADLLAFLDKMELGVSVLASESACYRVAYENVQDAQLAGLDYAELRFSPVFMAKTHQLPLELVIDAVVAGCQAASRELSMPVNLIGILSRSFAEQSCQQELQALLRVKDKLVGIDLAGDEKGFQAKRFKAHFTQVRDAGLQVTVHAGEADGPESIWQAINDLGAVRIGHGVAATQDENLMRHMAKNSISIECCLTSNLHTGACVDLTQHPIKTFIERGIIVTLNTDDPGVSCIEIADEYRIAHELVGLTKLQLRQIQCYGVAVSFATDGLKKQLYNANKKP